MPHLCHQCGKFFVSRLRWIVCKRLIFKWVNGGFVYLQKMVDVMTFLLNLQTTQIAYSSSRLSWLLPFDLPSSLRGENTTLCYR